MGVRLVYDYLKINLSSLLEYKSSFAIGVFGMMLNNVVWLFFWFIIMNKFDEINGWNYINILQIYTLTTMSWGLVGIFAGNRGRISHIIETGALDFYLATPANELVHLLTSRIEMMSIGDLVFGIILAFFCVSNPLLLIFLVLCISLIMISYIIIFASLSFFFGSSRSIENLSIMGILSFSTYPFSIFGGLAKFLLMTAIPVGFISGIPIELLSGFSWLQAALMLLVSAFFLSLSVFIFYRGLRRYESGNMIVPRVRPFKDSHKTI